MGDIERVHRIAPTVAVDPGRVHKSDETRDGRPEHRHHQENDTIELTVDLEIVEEVAAPPSTPTASDDGHLDIAV